MKKLLLITTLILALSAIMAINTGKSVFYSDSYMLRARGVEAAYWNPANLIPSKYIDLWLPGINTGVSISNNSFDLDTYNFVVSKPYLYDPDKELILNKIDGSVRASLDGSTSLLGFTVGNMSFSSSAHYMADLALSERYLELLLYGNTDSLYVFDKTTTDFKSLGYIDFTFGAGNFVLPFFPENYPQIRAGFSVSALLGLESVHLQDFYGRFSSTLDGASLYQDVTLRIGMGGYGRKAMLGLASNPTANLEIGLTLDNLFGQITWSAVTEELNYHFTADSIYAANIGDDFFTESHERITIDNFSTELPPELRLAALWRDSQYNISVDYLQGFKNSVTTSKIGRLSLGAQVFPAKFLPLTFGLGLGSSEYPWRTSYGFGLKSSTGEIGVSVQSFESFIPGVKSKGVSFGSFIRLWI